MRLPALQTYHEVVPTQCRLSLGILKTRDPQLHQTLDIHAHTTLGTQAHHTTHTTMETKGFPSLYKHSLLLFSPFHAFSLWLGMSPSVCRRNYQVCPANLDPSPTWPAAAQTGHILAGGLN